MCNTGINIDKNGNIYRERSGEILKVWVEDNAFTGAGHHIIPVHGTTKGDPEYDFECRKKIMKKAKIQYKCKGCKYFEINDFYSDGVCWENVTGGRRWQRLAHLISVQYPDKIIHVNKTKKNKNGFLILPESCPKRETIKEELRSTKGGEQ